MADYTYATTPSKALYDEYTEREQERADKASAAYAEQEKAANENYATAITGIHNNNVATAEETAAYDTEKTIASYDDTFDANAASELARRRALKEQMASYGLSQSGFNATNQTALTVARNNADAATRVARQQAVDAIDEELCKYKAESASDLAKTLAESERESANRVLQNNQLLQQSVHSNAMDQVGLYHNDENLRLDQDRLDLERDEVEGNLQLGQDRLDLDRETQKSNEDILLKDYVDEHNTQMFGFIMDAFESGNTELAKAYAKQLWMIDEDGNVVDLEGFEIESASNFVDDRVARNDEVTDRELDIEESKVEEPNTVQSSDKGNWEHFGIDSRWDTTIDNLINDFRGIQIYNSAEYQMEPNAISGFSSFKESLGTFRTLLGNDDAFFTLLSLAFGISKEQYEDGTFGLNQYSS